MVVSEGIGRDYLESRKRADSLTNLVLLDFQDSAELPAMLSAADVLVALLDSDCGRFSVPSKVLVYLSAARPVLIVAPEVNLAARTVVNAGAGLCVPPTDPMALTESARRFALNPLLRAQMGARARTHAELHFCIDEIANKFDTVLSGAVSRNCASRQAAAMAPGNR